MNSKTIVRRKSDGLQGVVCFDEEKRQRPEGVVTVVYEGRSSVDVVKVDEVEEIGQENAVPCFNKCGAGRGASCCIFLVGEAGDLKCARHSEFRQILIARSRKPSSHAKRLPVEMYPNCQLPTR
ncbi:hypothetical protein HGA64_01070 [Candidatus Falkowbacteria bacterium]|nr:hypothetical protein [Candidatus Falkowbacteria bacterium]